MAVTTKPRDCFSRPASEQAIAANSLPAELPTQQKNSRFADAFLLLRVFVFAATARYILRLKLPRVAHFVEPGSNPRPVDPDRIKKIAAYVETAIRRGRPLVRPGCLTRGLTRYFFLRRAGLDVALHFGMGQIDGEFVGHCWLVKDGQPFLEREDTARYVKMYQISIKGGEAPTPPLTVNLGTWRDP
jgi:transglutaminase superfamily protein